MVAKLVIRYCLLSLWNYVRICSRPLSHYFEAVKYLETDFKALITEMAQDRRMTDNDQSDLSRIHAPRVN